jgi:hypothetical protein
VTLPFIGSSTEGLDAAYALQENLEFEASVWSQGFFEPSTATLNALLQKLGEFDFAVFVFSPDDVLRLRGDEFRAARDNVLFELGLFYGRLGAERCFFAMPRGICDFHLPTDLLGIVPLTYFVARSDGNLIAALATAANQVRRTLRKVVQAPPAAPGQKPLTKSNLRSLQDFVAAWNGPDLAGARDQVRGMPLGEFGPEHDALARVFAFLESLSDSVLAGNIDEQEARFHFGEAIPSVWSVAFTELAPPNHADEWWEPAPKIAQLSQRWTK